MNENYFFTSVRHSGPERRPFVEGSHESKGRTFSTNEFALTLREDRAQQSFLFQKWLKVTISKIYSMIGLLWRLSWNLEQGGVRMKSLNNRLRLETHGRKCAVCYVDLQNLLQKKPLLLNNTTLACSEWFSQVLNLTMCPSVLIHSVISCYFNHIHYVTVWKMSRENEMHWGKIHFPCRIWNGMTGLLLEETNDKWNQGCVFL